MVDVPNLRLLIAEEPETARTSRLCRLGGKFTGRMIGEGLFPNQAEGIVLHACGDTAGYAGGRIALIHQRFSGGPEGDRQPARPPGGLCRAADAPGVMRRVLSWVLGLGLGLAHVGAAQSPASPRPRLVVAIAVDQLRADYIERFRQYFGPGGFNLFLTRGARFPQARYEHATTSTCPGHAVILTGSYAMVNGIIANDWFDVATGHETYCAQDTTVTLIGPAGRDVHPRNLFGATVGDVLKMATGGRSRVVTVSAKDRSAIMLGGHLADAAYWVIDSLFVTCTYYRDDLPAWAREFNAVGRDQQVRRQERGIGCSPPAAYEIMGPDDGAGEDDRAGLGRTFPHPIGSVEAFDQSPFLNDVVAEFALRAVAAEGLGKDAVPDLLGISFSANDRVGHAYGPESHEVIDVTVRLDRTLRALFASLDRTVGLGNIVVVLTADHGVGPMPESLQRLHRGAQARRLDPELVRTAVTGALEARYGRTPAPGWVAMARHAAALSQPGRHHRTPDSAGRSPASGAGGGPRGARGARGADRHGARARPGRQRGERPGPFLSPGPWRRPVLSVGALLDGGRAARPAPTIRAGGGTISRCRCSGSAPDQRPASTTGPPRWPTSLPRSRPCSGCSPPAGRRAGC